MYGSCFSFRMEIGGDFPLLIIKQNVMNKKRIDAVSHYAFVTTLGLDVLIRTLVRKKIIRMEDFKEEIDFTVGEMRKSEKTEHVEALEELKALYSTLDSAEHRLRYAEKIGML